MAARPGGGVNGLLWLIPIVVPMVGFIFIVPYLVLREILDRQSVRANDQAMEVLRERSAKGGIAEEEYRKRKGEPERR